MMDDVLHPREVGVADRRLSKLPAFVVAQAVTAPVGNIERRIGEDEIGFQIWMAIVVKSIAVGDLAPSEHADDGTLDPDLVAALRAFQTRHGLTPDGVLGTRTFTVLSVPFLLRHAVVAQ